MNHFSLQGNMEYPKQQWKQQGDDYPEIYLQGFYETYSLNIFLNNHADYFHHQNYSDHSTMSLNRSSQNLELSPEGSSPHVILHQQLEHFQQSNQLQRAGFPVESITSCGQQVIVTSHQGLPVYGAAAEPAKQSETPRTCILALAMMIAGIPTVPVPTVKTEDMVLAAQKFRDDNPNLSSDIDEMLKVKRDRKEAFMNDSPLQMKVNIADERINWKRMRECTILYPQVNVLLKESGDQADTKKVKSNNLMHL